MVNQSNFKFYFIDTLFLLVPIFSLVLSYPFGILSIILFFMKWTSEGFRQILWLQILCSGLCLFTQRELYLFSLGFYSIGMYYYSRYEIPGKPTGYQKHKFILKDKKELDLFIYYPSNKGKETSVHQLPISDSKERMYKFIAVQTQIGQKPVAKWKVDWRFGCLQKEKMKVIVKGQVETSGKDKLNPIVVFCPGTSMHPNLYSSIIRGLVKEYAIVFALDHAKYDNICPEDRSPEAFRKQREAEINRRSDELIQLINAIQKDQFAQITKGKANTQQIFLCGHSYGGSTIISTALKTKSAGVMLLDPWTWPVPRKDLQQFAEKKQPVIIWRSLSYSAHRETAFNEKQFEEINQLAQNEQTVCGLMPNGDHMTMCDLPFIFPREYGNANLVSNTNCLNELTKHYYKAMNIFIQLIQQKQFTKEKFFQTYEEYEKNQSDFQIAIWNEDDRNEDKN